MTTTKTIAAVAAVAGVFAFTSAGPAAEASSAITMKPLHGVSFDIGSSRAVSYFVSENGRCQLVLTLGAEPNWDEDGFATTRFEAAINAGKATRYVSSEGKSFEFSCAADAQAMNVSPVGQVTASGE